MNTIVNVALPFFAVIAAGYAALRWGYVDRAAVIGVGSFVFHLALPALLIDKLSEAPVERLVDWRFLVVFYGASLLIYAGVVLVSLRLGSRLEDAAMRAFAAAFGNWGYMGVPLLLAAFGPEAAVVAVLAVLGDNLITSPLTVLLVEAGRSGRVGLAGASRVLFNVARNPLVVSSVLGFLLAASGLSLPVPVDRFLEMVGAAAAPCALFALGGSLVGVPLGSGRAETLSITGLRLIVHPLLVWVGAMFVLPLPADVMRAAVITAALPTATSVFVLAQRYDVLVLRCSTIVLLTHMGSVLTLSALLVAFVS